MNFKTENKLLNTFNFSSLTDIVFLLLVFFLLSSSFVVQSGIKVQLPKSSQTDVKPAKLVTISLTQDGTYYLNDRQTNPAQLPAQLQKLYVAEGDQVVVLKADERIDLGRVVSVMDIAKRVGFERYQIATQQRND